MLASLGGLGAFLILIIIAAIAIPIIGIIMVITDDSLEGVMMIIWILVILFFNILGAIIYMVLRSQNKQNILS